MAVAVPDYTRCRTIGHAWYDYDSADWAEDYWAQFGDPMTLRCERCSMERREVWAQSGRLVHRDYIRPTGYLYGRGERPTKDDFRLMMLSLRLKEARAARNGTKKR
jgi:hypothetical protein